MPKALLLASLSYYLLYVSLRSSTKLAYKLYCIKAHKVVKHLSQRRFYYLHQLRYRSANKVDKILRMDSYL
jgi:hypothetical protein